MASPARDVLEVHFKNTHSRHRGWKDIDPLTHRSAEEHVKEILRNSADLSLVECGETGTTFNPTLFFTLHGAKAGGLGQTLILGGALTSTQQILANCSARLPEGTLLVCDRQSLGRGRGNNLWISEEGCLMFSFTSSFRVGQSLPCVQYIASIAMIEAVESYVDRLKSVEEHVHNCLTRLKIKWPNDIYYDDKKIGGVMCSSTYVKGVYYTTIGVGFNLSNKEPSVCLSDVVGRKIAEQISREALLAEFVGNFACLKELFSEEGFPCLRQRYLTHWMHSNQQVNIVESVAGSIKNVPMIIKGVTDSGLLLAVNPEGHEYELSPDGNSLDFFTGLIRRKLR